MKGDTEARQALYNRKQIPLNAKEMKRHIESDLVTRERASARSLIFGSGPLETFLNWANVEIWKEESHHSKAWSPDTQHNETNYVNEDIYNNKTPSMYICPGLKDNFVFRL